MVVLTANRTLMADYPVLFDGMTGTIHPTPVPEAIMRTLVAPRVARNGLAARKAPLGLRRIESAPVNDGFQRSDVILCAPEELDQCIGPNTNIGAGSSSDPFGRGMSNSTMSDMAGGMLYTHTLYKRMLLELKKKKQALGSKYNLNFTWIPRMYWDNQTGAGAALGRRLFIQTTGRLQTLQWRMPFVRKSSKIFA